MEPMASDQLKGSPAPVIQSSPFLSPPRPHESIWKRSKKILGNNFEFFQQNFTDSPEHKSPKGETSGNGTTVGKRREQVRRAQKKHRARTDAYIKALEQEVVRLRKVEAESAKVSQRLFREKKYIKGLEEQVVLLQKGNIPNFQCFQGQQAGYETDMSAQEGAAGTAMVSLLGQNGNYVLTAQMPDMSYNMNATLNSASIAGAMKSPDFKVQCNLHWRNLALINPLANHQMAIEFVLRLEAACMPHLHAHMADPSGSFVSGHSLTASACLISQSSSPVSAPSSWAVSHAEIERLFHLSLSLNLCGEITPVEAWNRIWLHPLASGLTVEGLTTIEGNLRGLITCYGFGGVIDESSFNTILDDGFKISHLSRHG